MKSTELRIGSLVEYNGYIMSVYSIIGAYPRKDPRFDNKVLIDLFDGAGLLTATMGEIKPIPLTEEWLLKFGAKKSGIEYKLKASALEVTIRINAGHVYCEFGNVYLGGRIQYVHELQNLVYSLCGKELKLNP